MHFVLFLLLSFFTLFSSNVQAQIDTAAKQAFVMDYETGLVLLDKNADEHMPTSSMSKVMTMYLVFEALQKGQISLDTEFLVSEKAWRKTGSKMFVLVDKKVRVEDLIRGVVVQSGNDATIVLAEGLAGSEELFVEALNRKAKELGMHNSKFNNASGWPEPEHYSTARDLATLARAMIKDFPEYYHYYNETEFEYAKINQKNRNPLLYVDIGADGMKTGHTDIGGYGLIGTGLNKEGRRIVMVLNGMKSKTERKTESIRVLQWAMNSFAIISLFKNQAVLDSVEIYLGRHEKVGLRAANQLDIIVPRFHVKDIEVQIEYNNPIKAPIKKGQTLGIARVNVPGYEQKLEVPLIANKAVKQLPLALRLITKARLATTGKGRFND